MFIAVCLFSRSCERCDSGTAAPLPDSRPDPISAVSEPVLRLFAVRFKVPRLGCYTEVREMADSIDKFEQRTAETPREVADRMLPEDPVYRELAEKVVFFKIKEIEGASEKALETKAPADAINLGLVAGMQIVAKLYAQRIYYLPEVIMASRTMTKGIAVAEAKMPGGRESRGRVIMHAVEGDPHDIGKNIAAVMMRAAGYEVIDLGKDVPAAEAVAKAAEVRPLFMSGTALMTTTMDALPKEATMLKEKGIGVPLMGCGSAVTREFANSYDLGIYSEKAPQTPPIADRLLEGWDWKRIRSEWDDIVKEAQRWRTAATRCRTVRGSGARST